MAHGTREYLPLNIEEEDNDDQDVITPPIESLSSLKKLSHSNLARICEYDGV